MKILIITPSYKPAFVYGGPIFSVAYLCEQLAKENELLVLSTTANGAIELAVNTTDVQLIDGVRVRFFKRQTKDHSHLSFGLLRYLWNNGAHYDVIHIQSWWNLVALFSSLICRIRGWRYVITPRGMLSPYTYQSSFFKRVIHVLLGNFLLKSAVINATTIDELNKVEKLNRKYTIRVVPNYVSLKIPLMERHRNEVFQLLFLSRIHPKKGLDTLIRSLLLLEFKFHLHIVGDGDQNYVESLKKLAEKLNVSNYITWHGSVYGQKKFEIYNSSDLMILPSHDENFANSVLEALLVGTPVLVSDNVGLATFVQESNLGWVYKGDATQLSIAIKSAFEEVAKRKYVNENARSIVQAEFNHDEITRKYLTVYKN